MLPSKRFLRGATQVTRWLPVEVRVTLAWVRSRSFLLEEVQKVSNVLAGLCTVVLTNSDEEV